MRRGWRVALFVVGLVIVLNLLLGALGTVTGGTPGGPDSSSYATASRGTAAYAELLGREGHAVEQVSTLPHATPPSPGSTVFLLEPPDVAPADVVALAAFVRAGGRLVASGLPRNALRGLEMRSWSKAVGPRLARLDGGLTIQTDGATWRQTTGNIQHGFLLFRSLGRGVVDLLPDASPLENRLLGTADNAAFGLRLAGPASRPVEFLESYHGYGRTAGLSALPLSWKLLLAGLALAALVWLVARSRRFGPAEPEARELPPARRAYVDSLAAVVARSGQREAAVEPVRRHVRRSVERRLAIAPDAGGDAFRSGAKRLGLADDEVDALLGTARTDAEVLAIGRALARIGEDQR